MNSRSSVSLLAILAGLTVATVAAGQTPAPDLDAIAKRVIAQEHVVGASVLVARGNKILLHRGYGYADLGLVGSSRVDLQACKLEYSIVSPK